MPLVCRKFRGIWQSSEFGRIEQGWIVSSDAFSALRAGLGEGSERSEPGYTGSG